MGLRPEPQTVFFLEAKRGLSDVFTEMLAESALVGKAALLRHLGELAVARLKHLASGLDSNPHEKSLGTHCERFNKSTVQLPRRDADVLRKRLDGQLFTEPLTDAFNRAIDGEVRTQGIVGGSVALRGTHHTNDGVVTVEEGQFVSDEPVGEALAVEEEFDDVEFGLA